MPFIPTPAPALAPNRCLSFSSHSICFLSTSLFQGSSIVLLKSLSSSIVPLKSLSLSSSSSNLFLPSQISFLTSGFALPFFVFPCSFHRSTTTPAPPTPTPLQYATPLLVRRKWTARLVLTVLFPRLLLELELELEVERNLECVSVFSEMVAVKSCCVCGGLLHLVVSLLLQAMLHGQHRSRAQLSLHSSRRFRPRTHGHCCRFHRIVIKKENKKQKIHDWNRFGGKSVSTSLRTSIDSMVLSLSSQVCKEDSFLFVLFKKKPGSGSFGDCCSGCSVQLSHWRSDVAAGAAGPVCSVETKRGEKAGTNH